jgi:hypothetical protein
MNTKQHFTVEEVREALEITKPFRIESVSIEYPFYIHASFGLGANGMGSGIAFGEGDRASEEEPFEWTWNSDNVGTRDICGSVKNYPTLFGVVGTFWREVEKEMKDKDLSASCGACGEGYFLVHDCDQDESKETRVSKYFEAEVISQTLSIRANSAEEAEDKYDAYFNSENCDECEKMGRDCDCVNETEDCYHNMDEGTEVLEVLCSCGEWVVSGSIEGHSFHHDHLKALLAKVAN